MPTRTSRRTATFSRPFTLASIDGLQPAGTYEIETDEELLEGLSFPVYRRVAMVIMLPAAPGSMINAQVVGITPEELAEAEQREIV